MDAAQCLATLKALGAEAVADVVMDPAWRRDEGRPNCAARDGERLPGRRFRGRAGARVPMAEK